MKKPFYLSLCLTIFSACSHKDDIAVSDIHISHTYSNANKVVPLDEALRHLDSFLLEVYPETQTKGSPHKQIASITKYYKPVTKAENADIIPSLYIINFDDYEGFAILGAQYGMPDVVMVTENAQLDTTDYSVILPSQEIDTSSAQMPDNGNMDEVLEEYEGEMLPDTVYFEDTEDFYTVDALEDATAGFITQIVQNALALQCADDVHQYIGGCTPEDNGGGNSNGFGNEYVHRPHIYAEKSRLMNFSWGQTAPYNNYCFRSNGEHALSGCSATAIAMITAYLEWPNILSINGVQINWQEMKTCFRANMLSANGQEYVALLFGSIYNNISKWATSGFTLILPSQIESWMSSHGYYNVHRETFSSFTESHLASISNMLQQNKPIFFSALARGIPEAFKDGHSWVIDGAKYTEFDYYMLHFNFGWNGSCNGYFFPAVINPNSGYYDPEDNGNHENINYTWHYQMITYDGPSSISDQYYFTY